MSGFGEGFGRVLGAVWNLLAPLGPLLALFFGMIFTLFFINLTPAASGRHLVPFWLHFDGFEQGRGGPGTITLLFLERFGKGFGELLGEVGSLSGRHLGSIWCISSWKSVPLILMFYGTDSQL